MIHFQKSSLHESQFSDGMGWKSPSWTLNTSYIQAAGRTVQYQVDVTQVQSDHL